MYNPLRIDPSEIKITDFRAIHSRLWGLTPAEAERERKLREHREDLAVIALVARFRCVYDSEAPIRITLMSDGRPALVKRRSAAAIIDEVAENRGISVEEIKGRSKTVRPVAARLEAYYRLVTERPDLSYPRIGALFGRDHTSVLSGVRRHAENNGLPPVVRT